MNNPKSTSRPQIRNIGIGDLRNYKLPWPAKVSILHRISGAALFLTLPLQLWLFDLSLSSETSFERFRTIVANGFVRLVLLGLGWAILHHACAGIRFLALDMHWGVDKESARRSSIWVFFVSIPLTLLLALFLFGAWS
jgi:succinate dehydrogenase / fumarate reductase cytochrome b subunit